VTRPPKESVYDTVYEKHHAAAIKALYNGSATPEQQKMALVWIVTNAARYNETTDRGERTHETSFANGRRFVGEVIVKLLNINLEIFGEKHGD